MTSVCSSTMLRPEFRKGFFGLVNAAQLGSSVGRVGGFGWASAVLSFSFVVFCFCNMVSIL